jgi:alginate O-acetyltransferase complex protein AlgI
LAVPRLWPDRQRYDQVMRPVGQILTFVSVAVSLAFFRSPTIGTALNVLKGMIGLNGIALPQTTFDHLGSLGRLLRNIGVTSVGPELWGDVGPEKIVIWVLALMFIALTLPNTLQILDQYEPALGVKPRPMGSTIDRIVKWNASLAWAIGVSVVAMIGILSLGGPSEFLYWQF